jgi:integrase
MALLGTQASFQQDGGHPVPNISGAAPLRINHHQPPFGCSSEAGLRGADCGLLSADLAAGIRRVKGAKRLGVPVGNWLTAEQGKRLLLTADGETLREKRDYATLAILLGCGLRRAELTAMRVEDIQQREEHWVIADLIGKGGHVRTIPVRDWVKAGIDAWSPRPGLRAVRSFVRSTKLAGFAAPVSAPRSFGAS